MKTNQEIQIEAQRLMVLGRQYQDDRRQVTATVETIPLSRVLMQLPESRVTTHHDAEPKSESVHTHRRERFVEAAVESDELVYRLMERETETTGSGQIVSDGAPSLVMKSESPFDPLYTGYELAEEERLAELLMPYAERTADRNGPDPAAAKAVAEVEAIVETDLLSPADRMRTKAEITDFLEGRLEASVFIVHAIERQCGREGRREQMTERHEMKLTIGEP